MADNVLVDNVDESDFTVSTEELSDGSHLQSFELHSESAGTKTKFGTASNPIKVDPTGDTTQPVSHAALTELAAAIDTEVQVDVVGALPAGTNAIGKLAANSGVDIGDVDVTSVPADPFGANADAAATAGSTGSIQAKLRLMTSQLDAIKTAVETLDNAISGSEMQVDIVSGGAGGTQYTEADTDASITGTAVMWEDTSDTLRAVSASKPLPVGDAGGSLTVDNAALTELAAAIDTEVQVDVVGALPAGTNAIGKLAANSGVDIGDVDVTSVPADPFGANADAAVSAGATGSMQAKLRRISSDIDSIKTAVETLDNTVSGTELQTDIISIPAAARTTDSIAAAIQTDAIMQGLTALTPAFAKIDAATSGDNTLLAAQGAGTKIRVHSLFVIASAAVTIRFESGAGGTALTGQMVLAASGGFVLPFNPAGWFEAGDNALLNLELSGAISVDGAFQYTVVST